MKRRLACLLAVMALGCDRGSGKAGAPAAAAPTDAQAVEAAWKKWCAFVADGDGSGAWGCLSKRTREERSALFRTDAGRITVLSGAALEAEARRWGVAAGVIQGLNAEGLAALALSRELGRPDGAVVERRAFSGVDIQGNLAIVRLTAASGPVEAVALVREEGGWRLDDAESRRAAAATGGSK